MRQHGRLKARKRESTRAAPGQIGGHEINPDGGTEQGCESEPCPLGEMKVPGNRANLHPFEHNRDGGESLEKRNRVR